MAKVRGQARGGVGRWQTSAEGLGNMDGHSKDRQKQWEINSIPRREVEGDWLSISQKDKAQATSRSKQQDHCIPQEEENNF